jgi:hypothetical protein
MISWLRVSVFCLPLVTGTVGCMPVVAGSGAAGSGGARSSDDAAGDVAPAGRGGQVGAGSGGTPATADAGSGGQGGGPRDGGPATGTGGASAVALPLVVTDYFNNQGWFGDVGILTVVHPGSTVIRQFSANEGNCAARMPGARGHCLEIVYTPPATVPAPPSGGPFLGVYFLRSLRATHTEVTPAGRPGDPNWGLEPGLAVAPGATQISFYAASATANQSVTFRAGTDKDSFVLPETTEILKTTWTRYTLPLSGGTYPAGILGAFAWAIKDTRAPARFYVDDLVWENGGPGTMPPPAPTGTRNGVREFVIMNHCPQTIWVGITGAPVPEGGGFALAAGATHTVAAPAAPWSGRFWGRTGCPFAQAAAGACQTGDCGGKLACAGAIGSTPATLAEFTLSANAAAAPDFYDLSLVDGYNLPMAIAPVEGTYSKRPGVANDCLRPSCVSDLNATCPAELRLSDSAGKVIGCDSACDRLKTDEYCCAGAHDKPETCPPFSYSQTFKAACPTAYSYAYDDATSTFTCAGEDYAIWFCPP